MRGDNYLPYDEQFKEILNQNEIGRIKDYKLREIRMKYWDLRHKSFLDEHRIPDSRISAVWDDLCIQEKKELEEYKRLQQEGNHNER